MNYYFVCPSLLSAILFLMLYVGDARTQEQITKASSLKDTQWHTWTCTLGWPVQGIWQKGAKGTDVNAVDR